MMEDWYKIKKFISEDDIINFFQLKSQIIDFLSEIQNIFIEEPKNFDIDYIIEKDF